MLDILINNAMIVDGSGNPGYFADVGIKNNKIQIFKYKLQNLNSKKTINAKGMILSPGFIDFHAHSGLRILGSVHIMLERASARVPVVSSCKRTVPSGSVPSL